MIAFEVPCPNLKSVCRYLDRVTVSGRFAKGGQCMQNAALPEYTDIPACFHFAALLLLTHVIYHVGWTHMRPCFTQISIPTYHMGCRVTVLIVVAEWIRLNKYTEYWPIRNTSKKYEVVSSFFHYFSDFPGFSNKIHLFLQKYTQK